MLPCQFWQCSDSFCILWASVCSICTARFGTCNQGNIPQEHRGGHITHSFNVLTSCLHTPSIILDQQQVSSTKIFFFSFKCELIQFAPETVNIFRSRTARTPRWGMLYDIMRPVTFIPFPRHHLANEPRSNENQLLPNTMKTPQIPAQSSALHHQEVATRLNPNFQPNPKSPSKIN